MNQDDVNEPTKSIQRLRYSIQRPERKCNQPTNQRSQPTQPTNSARQADQHDTTSTKQKQPQKSRRRRMHPQEKKQNNIIDQCYDQLSAGIVKTTLADGDDRPSLDSDELLFRLCRRPRGGHGPSGLSIGPTKRLDEHIVGSPPSTRDIAVIDGRADGEYHFPSYGGCFSTQVLDTGRRS
jgi:hypothetical protein